MPSLIERLRNVYQTNEAENQSASSNSWIPKRDYEKGSFLGQARAVAGEAGGLSQHRASQIAESNTAYEQSSELVWHSVEIFLLENYGQEGHDVRMEHFQESWVKYLDKYGEELPFALAEAATYINENPFVNFAGYLDKVVIKKLVSEFRKSKNQ